MSDIICVTSPNDCDRRLAADYVGVDESIQLVDNTNMIPTSDAAGCHIAENYLDSKGTRIYY